MVLERIYECLGNLHPLELAIVALGDAVHDAQSCPWSHSAHSPIEHHAHRAHVDALTALGGAIYIFDPFRPVERIMEALSLIIDAGTYGRKRDFIPDPLQQVVKGLSTLGFYLAPEVDAIYFQWHNRDGFT